jgi:toxin ParE1/3/4
MNEIMYYITYKLRNPQAANHLVNLVENAILERLPYADSYEIYNSKKERADNYYRIYIKNFVIYYVVIDGEKDENKIMEVRRILYNKRNSSELLP